jgi:hypothetical protein
VRTVMLTCSFVSRRLAESPEEAAGPGPPGGLSPCCRRRGMQGEECATPVEMYVKRVRVEKKQKQEAARTYLVSYISSSLLVRPVRVHAREVESHDVRIVLMFGAKRTKQIKESKQESYTSRVGVIM